ncbi:MAG: DegV family protein [Anaerolineae bacterium]|nr:DegV family protein [Anaerolineae bacterium]MCX8066654.1 DegV family protein [Anaerolineae bacterium]MDW7991052.1 DegV family protein [Anaerolineae bacterium]
MGQVRIVTDGDAYLDPRWARTLDITVVPLRVQVGDEIYQDKDGSHNEAVLARMAQERVRPMVIGPTAEDLQRVYARLVRTTDTILSIHSSGKLSPIVQNARLAATAFLGRCDITVLDSQTTSLGLGILVREAARMAQAGYSMAQILRYLRGMISRIYFVMVTDTLDYLERSGRISASQSILGTMLGIKPLLMMEEGEIIPAEKVRNREKGLDKLVEFIGEFPQVEEIAILQPMSYPTDETVLLQERLSGLFPSLAPVPILVYGPVLASHVGPDGLGLVVYEGMED